MRTIKNENWGQGHAPEKEEIVLCKTNRKVSNIRKKLAAFPLIALLLMAAIVPCSAAEPEGSAGEDITAAVSSSDLIPIERSANNINGEMTIVEIFEVSASVDPNDLVKSNFAQSGYLYSMDSIVKNSFTDTREKDVEKQYEAATDTKEWEENVKKLPISVEYSEGNFVGTLYLNPQTIDVVVTETTPKSSTRSVTKTYTMEYNDPSQIPETMNGLPRTSLTWAEASYYEGSSIPSSYTATAVYSKKSTTNVDSAWKVVATYQGTARFEDTDNIRYTVTYKGVEIPEGYIVDDFGNLVEPEAKGPGAGIIAARIFGGLLILAAVIAAALVIPYAIRRGWLASRKLVVQAQDFDTGNYETIQKVRLKKKSPTFELDTLKAPSSRHFLCEMSAPLAKKFRGKIITVMADGQVACKNQIEPINDTDKYVFSVDLEVVDSGPVDTFAL